MLWSALLPLLCSSTSMVNVVFSVVISVVYLSARIMLWSALLSLLFLSTSMVNDVASVIIAPVWYVPAWFLL